MNEKQIQNFYLSIFKMKDIWYIHLPNSTFKSKYHTHLKYFPDLFFAYNNMYYLREIGVENRNKERKRKQKEYMMKIKNTNPDVTDVKIILSLDAAIKDLKGIGILIDNADKMK